MSSHFIIRPLESQAPLCLTVRLNTICQFETKYLTKKTSQFFYIRRIYGRSLNMELLSWCDSEYDFNGEFFIIIESTRIYNWDWLCQYCGGQQVKRKCSHQYFLAHDGLKFGNTELVGSRMFCIFANYVTVLINLHQHNWLTSSFLNLHLCSTFVYQIYLSRRSFVCLRYPWNSSIFVSNFWNRLSTRFGF